MTLSRLISLGAVLWLAGCAIAPAPLPDSPWQHRVEHLSALQEWTAQGKIALRNGDQSESANLHWRQQRTLTTVQLSGPLGLQATQISSDGQILQVLQGDSERQFDLSNPEVMARETGWDLPLAALPYWLKGIPAPQPGPVKMDVVDDLLQTLQQAGWQILYERYQRVDDYLLPSRLTLERGATRAKVIIQTWQPAALP